jgi:DNA-binding NtrC family response regulator
MRYKVLIVDDEAANLRALERLFREDYEVLTAESGTEAVELLQEQDVAVLITDQRMPEMTGTDLLMNTISLRPRMVRIILTGYTDVDALVAAINGAQVYKYITKPWNNEDLKSTVARSLEHYEANKESYELALANERLVSRMREIRQLAMLGSEIRQ